ncbi:MAG: 2-oxoacid:acceptor oxidoreductase family protein [Coriobacteriia bacterium]|nr:2-oxoacid:acceptor oxidoreductase family protein [Coriobacteriia bacterium]
MIEVLWHGRGGQGAFTAARLLGAAAALAPGTHALAFPSFGPERRGAPMRAFTKLSDAPVGDRSAINQADFVVYLDQTLFAQGWERELKPGGRALVNTTHSFDDPRILSLDASGLSLEVLGRDIPNTVFLGALAVLCEGLQPDQAKEAVRQYMAPKLHDANLRIIDRVVAQLVQGEAAAPATGAAPAEVGKASNCEAGTPAAGLEALDQPQPPANRRIPTLRTPPADHAVYARNTCWDAGHLVTKNAGWRTQCPVIDPAACTGCLKCYMDCPDGTIYKVKAATSVTPTGGGEAAGVEKSTPNAGTPIAIDYDFCKGCGMCVRACRFGALSMIPEGGQA